MQCDILNTTNRARRLNLAEGGNNMAKFKVGDCVIGNEEAKRYNITDTGWIGYVVAVHKNGEIRVKRKSGVMTYNVKSSCFDLYEDSVPHTIPTISDIKVINEERNEYTIVNGKRNKSTKAIVPTTSVVVTLSDGRTGTATCDTSEFDIRTGALTAIANIVFNGKFETAYEKYNKKQEKLAKEIDRIERTCAVCGKTYDTAEEARACEKAHTDRKKQKHENYLIRKEAKRRIAEAEREGRIKEVMAELLK